VYATLTETDACRGSRFEWELMLECLSFLLAESLLRIQSIQDISIWSLYSFELGFLWYFYGLKVECCFLSGF
jgi:hypothetical protein